MGEKVDRIRCSGWACWPLAPGNASATDSPSTPHKNGLAAIDGNNVRHTSTYAAERHLSALAAIDFVASACCFIDVYRGDS